MTKKEAVRAGLMKPEPGSHEAVVRGYSDELVQGIIDDLGKRNLRDLRDHATRWQAERSSAARAERRRRKAAGTWNPEKAMERRVA